jgi:hypothetical protein
MKCNLCSPGPPSTKTTTGDTLLSLLLSLKVGNIPGEVAAESAVETARRATDSCVATILSILMISRLHRGCCLSSVAQPTESMKYRTCNLMLSPQRLLYSSTSICGSHIHIISKHLIYGIRLLMPEHIAAINATPHAKYRQILTLR